ncbi:ACP S-malonyltransferase [Desulforhopalus singaporensis]|uniref:Malonyl CoA-acyl carrier protein transacylase n=1 Tax=Desulforhopalus singaporensis TaxID=91360 RepID=A0A1H0QNE3_9BACT|nr:ACP S-malonyltransferase [Desulforhopalus singaporensis]SDP18256.1 [acyl-carrier-protein] S-malonyltransferase [Desulforhopalus singaporensis]
MKIAVLFPGQGSQYLGMGQEFRKQYSQCDALMTLAEKVCDINLGQISDEGPMEKLTRAATLQPAITVANLICWQAFLQETAGRFDVSCFAGHSLGEYSALYGAGVISAEDAIRLVAKRGALMEREGDKNPGGMRALLGLNIEKVDQLIAAYDGPGVVTVANHNTPEQIVVSGTMEGLDGVTKLAEEAGAKVIPLNVSVANHSPLVAQAVPDFTRFLADITFSAPSVPVYFNVSAKTESEPEVMKERMAKQIASKVRWYEIISSMMESGVDTFIEIGPKTVLKGMMRKIAPKGANVTSLQFDTPETLTKCIETLG